jgi:ABC-type transport system substrate-binding protein
LPTYTAHYQELAETENTIADIVPELWLQYIGFRADRPPFSNLLVRQAFAHAIELEQLVQGHRHHDGGGVAGFVGAAHGAVGELQHLGEGVTLALAHTAVIPLPIVGGAGFG